MSENSLNKIVLSKAMAECSRREHCCNDIRNKLILWGVGIDDTENLISVLVKDDFINEARYTTAFVNDKFIYNKWGKIKISAHLRAKNIPSGLIKSSLDSIDNGLYTKVLKELITSHRRSVKSKNQYDLKAKLFRYGLSKGFESNLLYDILNDPDE